MPITHSQVSQASSGPRASGLLSRVRQLAWASVPVWSLGWLAFVPFLRLAIARRQARDWAVFGSYLVASVVEIVTFGASTPDSAAANFAGAVMIALMGVGAVHTLVSYRPSSTLPPVAPASPCELPNRRALTTARSRISRRREARELAREDPVLARELRIGRPDLPREYDDGGLVDLNNVSPEMLASSLGLTAPEVTGVMAARQQLGGFSSAEELSAYAELSPDRVDDIRDLIWFG